LRGASVASTARAIVGAGAFGVAFDLEEAFCAAAGLAMAAIIARKKTSRQVENNFMDTHLEI
jgi:hypothetical protein